MKLQAVLLAGILFPVLCFAQTQTGNASYNAGKNGLYVSHASMSFNTRVRITNLRNNMQVIAIVDGRIPVSDPRIADVSREAGDAIGMSRTGYTEIRIEELQPEHAAAPVVVSAPVPGPAPAAPTVVSAPVPGPAPAAPAVVSTPAPEPAAPVTPAPEPESAPAVAPVPAQQTPSAASPAQQAAAAPIVPAVAPAPVPARQTPPAASPARQTAAAAVVPAVIPAPVPARQTPSAVSPAQQTAPAASPAPTASASVQNPEPIVIENIQVPAPVQYMVVDRPTAICALSPLRAAILILTIIAVLLLAAILVLLLYRRGRVPLWPYYYPVWVRRHRRYKKNRRF